MVDLTSSPYYDSTVEEMEKGYTEILFTPGKTIQSRELNGISSYAKERSKKLASLMYKSGTIISGCSVVNIDIKNATVTMSPGTVFVDGEVYDIVFEKTNESGNIVSVNSSVVQKTLPIKTLGTEIIYVEIVSSVMSYLEDETLNDPAKGFDNYKEPGASRLMQLARFITTSHPDFNNKSYLGNPRIPIYTLKDGVLINNTSSENSVTEDKPASLSPIDVMDVMAQRNYETLGNYLVEGFKVSEILSEDATKVGLSISPGVAYINGIRRESTTTKTCYLAKDSVQTTLYNEEHIIQSGINEYALSNSPVVSAEVTAPVKETTSMTYSAGRTTTIYTPSGYPINKVLKVYTQGTGAKTFIEGTDYTISNNSIGWKSSGDHPASQYFIDYIYKPVLDPSKYSIISKGLYQKVLYLKVNSLGVAEIPLEYNNPSIYSIEKLEKVRATSGTAKAANGDVLVKGEHWYQQGNRIKLITMSNSVLPVEVVRGNENVDTIAINDAEIESIKYFSTEGETVYEKYSEDLVDYDYTYDKTNRTITWNGNKDTFPLYGETYIVYLKVPVDSTVNTIGEIKATFAYELPSDKYTNRTYTNYIKFASNVLYTGGDSNTFAVQSNIARTRKDYICLNKDGKITIVHGSTISENGIYEATIGPNLLVIAEVIVKPTSNNSVAIYQSENYRVRMKDIRDMFDKVKDIDYNLSLSALESFAETNAASYALRGIFTDAFVDLRNFDRAATESIAGNESKFAVPNIAESRLYPGFKRAAIDVEIDEDNTTAGKIGNVYHISEGANEVLWLQQPYGTNTRSLTEGVYESNLFPKFSISPDTDYFISDGVALENDEYIVIPNNFNTYTLENTATLNASVTSGHLSDSGYNSIDFWIYIHDPSTTTKILTFEGTGNFVTYSNGNILLHNLSSHSIFVSGVGKEFPGAWQHLAFTFTNKSLKVYHNGEELEVHKMKLLEYAANEKNWINNDLVSGVISSESGYSIAVAGSSDLHFHTDQCTGLKFGGNTTVSFASIRIYNKIYSSISELRQYMLAEILPDTSGLIGYYYEELGSAGVGNGAASSSNLGNLLKVGTTSGSKVAITELSVNNPSIGLQHILNVIDETAGSIPEATSETTLDNKSSNSKSTSQKVLRRDRYGWSYYDTTTTTVTTTTSAFTQVDTWYTKETESKIDDLGTFISGLSTPLYLRQLKITVTGSGLLPNTDPIEIKFDGQKVNLFALSTGTVGSPSNTDGCWKANNNGEFKCAFVIPAKTPIGIREVQMVIPGGPNTSVTYWGAGSITSKTSVERQTDTIVWKENSSSTTYTVVETNSSTTCSRCTSRCRTCPLAQTIFVNDPDLSTPIIEDIENYSDILVSSVDVYVRSFGPNTQFFTGFVELSDSGYPKSGTNGWVGDLRVFYGSEIQENEGKFEYGTAKHHVTFDTPIRLRGGKGYALVVGSPDKEARLWVAKVGESEPTISNVTGKKIIQTPDKGMLLSSPNSQTWTAYIDEDMKYAIYIKDFFSSSNLVEVPANYSALNGSTSGKYSILAYKEVKFATSNTSNVVNPNFFKFDTIYSNGEDHTGYVQFEYATALNGVYSNWTEFVPGSTVQITSEADSIKFRAKIFSFNKYSSPIVDNKAALTIGQYVMPSYFVSKSVESGKYNRVVAYVDKFMDEATASIDMQYSPDNGYTWRSLKTATIIPLYLTDKRYSGKTQYQYCMYDSLTIDAPKIMSLEMINLPSGESTGGLINTQEYAVAIALKDAYGYESPLSEPEYFTAMNTKAPKIKVRFDPNATGYAVYVKRRDAADSEYRLWYDSTCEAELTSSVNISDSTITIDGGKHFPTSGVILIGNEYIKYTAKDSQSGDIYVLKGVTRGYTNLGYGSTAAAHERGSTVILSDECVLDRGTITGNVVGLWKFKDYTIEKDHKGLNIYTFTFNLVGKGLVSDVSDSPKYHDSYPASFVSTSIKYKIEMANLDNSALVNKNSIIPGAGRVIINTSFEAF